MTVQDIIKSHQKEFDETISQYTADIASIRTGRASPVLVEDIEVEYYGSRSKVKELASVNAPEPRLLVIQPWDKSAVDAIVTAIRRSDIHIEPVVDGTIIRINIPQLTEERRKELIKVLKQKTEDARVRVRRIREEVWTRIQNAAKEGDLREDDKFRGKDDLQKSVDGYNSKIHDLEQRKESELMN